MENAYNSSTGYLLIFMKEKKLSKANQWRFNTQLCVNLELIIDCALIVYAK